MRVLHLTTWEERCGIAAYAADLVHALSRVGVVSEIHPLNRRERKYLSRPELHRALDAFSRRARDFDLVHLQHEFSFFGDEYGESIDGFAYLLRRLARQGSRCVVTFHTEWEFDGRLRSAFLPLRNAPEQLLRHLWARRWRWGVSPHFRRRRRPMQAVVHAKTTRRNLLQSGFRAENLHVLPMPIPERPMVAATDRQTAKEQLGYPQDCVLLSLFGFFAPHKGHASALEALRHLPRHYHLAFVGGPHPEASRDHSLERVLRRTAKRGELQGRVRCTGYVDEVTRDLYHAATDFCLLPYTECSLSASAAMSWALSSERPVIASRIPAFVEIAEAAECLVLCSPDAPHELAWQISRLAADSALQHLLIARAREYSARRSWGQMAAATVGIYGRLGLAPPLIAPQGECGQAEPARAAAAMGTVEPATMQSC